MIIFTISLRSSQLLVPAFFNSEYWGEKNYKYLYLYNVLRYIILIINLYFYHRILSKDLKKIDTIHYTDETLEPSKEINDLL